MTKRSTLFALVGAVLLTSGAATFGGYAIVTVDDLPEYLVAGKPYELSFMVRQHGFTPLANLHPRLTVTGGADTTLEARATNVTGRYVASIIPRRAEKVSIRIQSGFGNSEITLRPLQVVAANASAPHALAAAQRGEQLFFAKGCVTCHVRGDAGANGFKIGPDLTPKRFVADVAARFLADPTQGPLVGSGGNGARMPQLNLKPTEIASIVAYLNSEGQISRSSP